MSTTQTIQTATQEILDNHKGEFTLSEIKNAIAGDRQMRHSNWEDFAPFSTVAQHAMLNDDWQGDIINKAMDGRYISDKQAWCVAYYMKKLGLVK